MVAQDLTLILQQDNNGNELVAKLVRLRNRHAQSLGGLKKWPVRIWQQTLSLFLLPFSAEVVEQYLTYPLLTLFAEVRRN